MAAGRRGLGLRGKSLLAILLACLVAVLPAAVIGWQALESVREQLGRAYARDFVLLQRERILAPVQRELALAQRLAASQPTLDWLTDEADPGKRDAFFREAEGYRQMLRDHSYFVVSAATRNYYFNDAHQKFSPAPRFQVIPDGARDAWFFATMADAASFNVNVDKDIALDLTKVWINAVVETDGHRYGAAGTGLDLTAFVHDLVDSHEPGVTAMLVDRNGAVEAHPDTSLISFGSGTEAGASTGATQGTTLQSLLGTEIERNAFGAAMAESVRVPDDVPASWVTLDGRRQLLAVAFIPELNWHLVAAIDLHSARIFDLGLVLPVALGLLLVVIVLAIGFGSVVERIVLVPLGRLRQSATAIAAGRYDEKLPDAAADEIGDLTRAFSIMSDKVRRHTEELEGRVRQRTAELEAANGEMAAARRKIDDSIAYASLIQRAVLPQRELESLLGAMQFVIWLPRDVVGGDFWIVHPHGDGVLIGIFDCAGHGVGGALMTMLARSAIAEAIETIGPQDPAALLTSMDGTLRQRLSAAQHSRGLAVTTDAGLVWVDRAEAEVRFAGARIDLVTADGETIVTHAGGRRSLAGRRAGDFVNLSVPIRPGRIFYLLTDGLLDQSGGENGFGFGTDRLQALLRNLAGSAMVAQRDGMLAALATHQGTRTQTDDITVVAFCMG